MERFESRKQRELCAAAAAAAPGRAKRSPGRPPGRGARTGRRLGAPPEAALGSARRPGLQSIARRRTGLSPPGEGHRLASAPRPLRASSSPIYLVLVFGEEEEAGSAGAAQRDLGKRTIERIGLNARQSWLHVVVGDHPPRSQALSRPSPAQLQRGGGLVILQAVSWEGLERRKRCRLTYGLL
ncbi:Hypothetical predicted protein [Podarcis lilfordi]|uniref:Uncharacterized protein n=1 Tax=Podarcis lilfordi TaxID=74358 RepID=A0AA35PS09_9SAUR|nr:Hypothetical predicted protein [Podarcis lilfordi]